MNSRGSSEDSKQKNIFGLDIKEKLKLYAESVAKHPKGLVSKDARADVMGHVEDSLTPMGVPAFTEKLSTHERVHVIDIGSGGGFPGIPLVVVNPNIELTCIESIAWKCNFLTEISRQLKVDDRVTVICGRAEEVALDKKFAEAADIATLRAVANINTALEYAAPLLRMGGSAMLWTTPKQAEAVVSTSMLQRELGLDEPTLLEAPSKIRQEGRLLVSKKTRSCLAEYPRRTGLAKKKPLGSS